jgi:ATP-dependent Lon protease
MNKKKVVSNESKDITLFIEDKIDKLNQMIQKTFLSIQEYKKWEIFKTSDVLQATQILKELNQKTKELREDTDKQQTYLLESYQKISDKLCACFSKYGTHSMKDLIQLLLGEITLPTNELQKSKIDIITNYLHPIGFKIVNYKSAHSRYSGVLCCNKLVEDIEDIHTYNDYECMSLQESKVFHTKVYGVQLFLRNEKAHKMYIIWAIADNILLDCLSNKYVDERKRIFLNQTPNKTILNYIETMSIKEILTIGDQDFSKKEAVILHNVNLTKKTKIDILIKMITEMDWVDIRTFFISLLVYDCDTTITYICSLLYDMITIHNRELTASENNILYDSFPWKIKCLLKDCISDSIKYTDEINQKYDINRLSIEQQVYLFQAPEMVKEKAMIKLKEMKGKGDDNTKAKQYLEGLLRIPFDIYREEPILKLVKKINQWFLQIQKNKIIESFSIEPKEKYTTIEILKHCKKIQENIHTKIIEFIREKLPSLKIKKLQSLIKGGKRGNKETLIAELNKLITDNQGLLYSIHDQISDEPLNISKIMKDMTMYCEEIEGIGQSLKTITKKLDDSIYGHNYAKKQILKVFGQWMTGKQTGYCFGFEGAPGIGKTSLAKKGLTNCLIDVDGTPRPFHFIALGGSSNGSTLEGWGYTYQNSIWGKIVDILMESKCMNPIIYIDELDKVSKTEHGREIIGILTHLIDSSQNTDFQDKYFMGIPIDVSKVLFIFSYNDVEEIDKILLDRIHRIQFHNLSLEEKIVIVKNYIFPELNEKMGWDKETFVLSDSIISYIIETYTNEPGIRKLKELLFDMVGEINLEILKQITEIPITINETNLKEKYLKKYRKIREKKIHLEYKVGIINGLYANSLGQGGIIPVQCSFFPSNTFMELKCTGQIGNVMQESMNVARNLAWNLTPNEQKTALIKEMEMTKNQGIHIHCPEGATKKDGPSGGCCITLAIYSLLNKRPIKNNLAITGEIDLHGNITAIGGLEFKILGGIKSGVVHFLFPEENEEDYLDILEKYKDQELFQGITFTKISHIDEIIHSSILFSDARTK